MSKLPQISGRECIKALGKIGFYTLRQKGSHVILCRDVPFNEIVVPDHKVLDRGTLRSIIRKVGLDIEDFIDLL